MKTKILPLILIMSPVLAYAQFRPIIDSTIVCSSYYEFSENPNNSKKNLQFFYIVEEMPKPKIPVREIESMLEKRVRFNTQEMNYNGNIYLQCIINCKGQAGDYQINDCPAEFVNVGCQLLNIFRESIVNWETPKQRGHEVDLLTKVKVTINQGHFKVIAPDF
jgi:hypothetical protein